MTYFAPRTRLCRLYWNKRSVFAFVLLLPAATQAAQSVTLAWNPNSETNLAGYKLCYGPASGIYTNANSVGLVTNATVTGLVQGARYFFVVKAYDAAGLESGPSNEVSYTATNAPNTLPTLSLISSTTVFANRSTFPIPFTVSDAETPPAGLILGADSSNPALLPSANIVFGGSGTNRTLTLTPAPNQTGTTTVSITASDGQATNRQAFGLTVIREPVQFVYLPFQAENGSMVAPMYVSAEAAPSAITSIASSFPDLGSVSFTMTLPVSGVYVVWSRVLAPDSGHDSFYVSVDGGPEDVYDCADETWSSAWQWTRVTGRDGSATPLPALNPRTFTLAAGAHTFQFRGREAGTRLDRVLVSNDLDFIPQNAPPAGPFSLTSIAAAGSALTIECQAQPGATYRLAYKDSLTDATWTFLGNAKLATSNAVTWTGLAVNNSSARFYQVLLLP